MINSLSKSQVQSEQHNPLNETPLDQIKGVKNEL